jgi:hypothetical protein
VAVREVCSGVLEYAIDGVHRWIDDSSFRVGFGVGGYTGLGSLLFCLSRLSSLGKKEAELTKIALRLAELPRSHFIEVRELDLSNGLAGFLRGLEVFSSIIGLERAATTSLREDVKAALRRRIHEIDIAKSRGLAHGIDGVGFALGEALGSASLVEEVKLGGGCRALMHNGRWRLADELHEPDLCCGRAGASFFSSAQRSNVLSTRSDFNEARKQIIDGQYSLFKGVAGLLLSAARSAGKSADNPLLLTV